MEIFLHIHKLKILIWSSLKKPFEDVALQNERKPDIPEVGTIFSIYDAYLNKC